MLHLLKKWSDYNLKFRFKKAEATELKMTLVKNKTYDEFVVPTKFYCTFMEGVGQKKALELGQIVCHGNEIVLK